MYIYNADMYCDNCMQSILKTLPKPNYAEPWDTDDYPSYCLDNEESDCPQHCGACGLYFENALTSDGVEYVLERINESIENALEKGRALTWDRIIPLKGTAEESMTYYHGSRHVEIVRDWAEQLSSYNLDAEDKCLVELFLRLSEKP